MRKSVFCICVIKGVDQLHGSGTADQCLCFHYFLNLQNSSQYPSPVVVQPAMCQNWWKKTQNRFSPDASQLFSYVLNR